VNAHRARSPAHHRTGGTGHSNDERRQYHVPLKRESGGTSCPPIWKPFASGNADKVESPPPARLHSRHTPRATKTHTAQQQHSATTQRAGAKRSHPRPHTYRPKNLPNHAKARQTMPFHAAPRRCETKPSANLSHPRAPAQNKPTAAPNPSLYFCRLIINNEIVSVCRIRESIRYVCKPASPRFR